MKIVNIKGTNGSGKTTIAKQLVAKSEDAKIFWLTPLEDPDNTGYKVPVTILQDLGWALVGEYEPDKPMGGCDTIRRPIAKIVNIKQAIDYLVRKTEGAYWILFEGMMVGTIKSTFYDYLRELVVKYPDYDIEPLFVFLDTTIEGCMKRMAKRHAMERSDTLKDNVEKKLITMHRHMVAYDPKYCAVMNVDKIAERDMLKQFLVAVEDLDLWGYLYG